MIRKIEILLEDDNIIAINKPAGMLSIPDRFDPNIPNALSYLKSKREEIYVIHRLDRYTSGIMIFAKNSETHKVMSQQFQDRLPTKIYTAVVEGIPALEMGLIDAAIMESGIQRGKYLVSTKGKPSQTKYRVIEEMNRFSVVECKLLTGRTHQIRVHMEYIGNPLVVDHLYSHRDEFFLSELKKRYKKSKYEDERPLISRQPLHASELEFELNGKQYQITSELPKDMRALIQQLRKLG